MARPIDPPPARPPAGAGRATGGGRATGARASAAAGEPGPADDTARQEALRRSTWTWVRAAAILVTLLAGYQLLFILRGWFSMVLLTILAGLLATIIALVAMPAVRLLERRAGLPRSPAVLLALLVGIVLVSGLLYLITGPLVTEGRALIVRVPTLIARVNTSLRIGEGFLRHFGVSLSVPPGQLLTPNLRTLLPTATGVLLRGVTTSLTVLVEVVVALVVAFWLLKDGATLRASLVRQLPTRAGSELEFGLDAFLVVFGGFVRAQLLIALVIAALAGFGCALLGVPFPLVVAVTAGVFELIPLVGPFAGGAVAVFLALTRSPGLALATVVLFIGIHVVEGYVLAPRIQARFVRLHPLVSLLAVVVGAEAGGFLGAFLAVPAASLASVVMRSLVGDWRAARPDLFATAPMTAGRRRQRGLLREFTPIGASLRQAVRRWRAARGGPPRR